MKRRTVAGLLLGGLAVAALAVAALGWIRDPTDEPQEAIDVHPGDDIISCGSVVRDFSCQAHDILSYEAR